MIVYRLGGPIDEFDHLTPLPQWLRRATCASTAWMLQATLALADRAEQIGWRGDMRQLPSLGDTDPYEQDPYLVVKQEDDGATFVISARPLTWAEPLATRRIHTPDRDIPAAPHPTAEEISEALEQPATRHEAPPT